MNGEYCPNRHGPLAVGMKKAVFAGSKPGCSATLRKSPIVTRSGRHSSPDVKRPAISYVRSSPSGDGRASTPRYLKAAAKARAPSSDIRGM